MRGRSFVSSIVQRIFITLVGAFRVGIIEESYWKHMLWKFMKTNEKLPITSSLENEESLEVRALSLIK